MMKSTSKILVLSYSHLERDGRVLRQIRFLLGLGDVQLTVATHGSCPIEDPRVRFVPLPRRRTPLNKLVAGARLLSRRYDHYDPAFGGQVQLYRELKGRAFDLIVANDADTLPGAFELKGPATRILFDAHEYAPRQFEDRALFRLLVRPYATRILEDHLRDVDAMVTVSQGLAGAYAERFGVAPTVILNAPFLQKLTPSPVDPDRIELVHHGMASASRSPLLMFDLMDRLDPRFQLTLMLVPGSSALYRQVVERAQRHPRVRLIAPVAPERIARTINAMDLGVYMLSPTNFNNINALPNKILEFIQARLALAVWPTPEMARLVNAQGVGVVAADYSSAALAERLNRLDADEIAAFKLASHRAARELCADRIGARFRELACSLLESIPVTDIAGRGSPLLIAERGSP